MSVPHPHPLPRHAHTLPATPTDSESLSDVERDHDQEPEHEHEAHGDEPWLFRLLNRAAAFADVIAQHHHSHAKGRKEAAGMEAAQAEAGVEEEGEGDADADADPDVMCILGHDLARMGLPSDASSQAVDSEQEQEHQHSTASNDPSALPLSRRNTTQATWRNSAPHRWTHLSASSWLRKRKGGLGGDSGQERASPEEGGGEVGEHEVMVSEYERKGRSSQEEKMKSRGFVLSPPPAPLIQPVEDAPPVHTAPPKTKDIPHVPEVASPIPIAESTPDSIDSNAVAAGSAGDAPILSEAQKVDLIIEEFGAIAQGEEKETLLAETDASFFQDIAILVRRCSLHIIVFLDFGWFIYT